MTTPTSFSYVLHGQPTIQRCDRDVEQAELSEGEMFVVPRGIEHCPDGGPREAQVR